MKQPNQHQPQQPNQPKQPNNTSAHKDHIISLPLNGEVRELLDIVNEDDVVNATIDNAIDKYSDLSLAEKVKVGEFAMVTAIKLIATNDKAIEFGGSLIEELKNEKEARQKLEEENNVYKNTFKEIKENDNKCDEKIVSNMCTNILNLHAVKQTDNTMTVSGKELNRMTFISGMRYNKTPDNNKLYSIKK